MRRQARLELSRQLLRNEQEGWILDDRIPDLTDQLKSLGKRELPDLCDVFHTTDLTPGVQRRPVRGERVFRES